MEPPAFDTLEYAADGGLVTITLNRPDKLNALNGAVLADLQRAFRRARQEEGLRGVVLTGAGPKAFAAGADIGQFTELDALSGHRFALRGQAVLNAIEAMPAPVVAAINGYALGGGLELALACHLRVAVETAKVGLPEVTLGLIPGYGGTQRLARLVGRGIATELIVTGEPISAQRAYEAGLVNRVVPAEALMETARGLVETIAKRAPLAVAFALSALRAADLPLPQGLQQEAALFGQLCSTSDFREGVDAFLNRRPAAFTGA